MAQNFNSMTAAREWMHRPDDERYETLDDLYRAAQLDRDTCRTAARTAEQLIVLPGENNRLTISGGTRQADFTHYSFGQLAGLVGAPARYLAGLPAPLAAECLNHGIKHAGNRDVHSLLLRQYPDDPARLTLRSLNSMQYSRVWDAPLIDTIRRFTESDRSSGGTWQVPPSWPNSGRKPGGLYRSDRDLFMFLVNGGSIVTDPTARAAFNTPGQDSSGGTMYRGFVLKNSEVGAAAVSVTTFYFRVVCGNHILHGLTETRTFRRRHVGNGAQYLASDALRHVARWMQTPASTDERIISALAAREIAQTKEDTIAALRGKWKLTETQATKAYDLAEQHEQNPRSVWGIAQGITRLSQASDNLYNDDRFSLDQLAGQMLRQQARLVAA